jgi:hypothetical protein
MPLQARRMTHLLIRGLRSSLYPLAAFPVGLFSLAMALGGRRQSAAALQRRLLHTLLPASAPEPDRDRIVSFCLLNLPVNAPAFAVAGYLWLIPVLNLGYPLRPDVTAESLRQGTWGGPTLAGAWTVHAVGAVVFFVLIGVPLLSLIARLQCRAAAATLRSRPR